MITGDEEFLDDVFDQALAAATDGRRIDVDGLTGARPDLRSQVEAAVHLALEVAAPRTPGLPAVPGYQVVAELGRGGMGAVYLARQERLGGRLVALKMLPGADSLSARARSRFVAEATALGRLRHAHVVTVHDVVQTPTLCAYAMEWIEGQSLAGWLLSAPAPGRERLVCQWALQIARALAAVHAAGLVHRDVKPSNILLRADGTAVLVDFGLARELDAAITAEFAGTAPYAAPEQLAGDGSRVDARTDVYSLGATLFHALAGRAPYAGRTPAALARAIEQGALPWLRRANARVSRDLETIVATALAVSPARRYPDAAALADDLERLLALQPIAARPPGFAVRLVRLATRNRRTLLAAIAGGCLVLVAAWITFLIAMHRAAIPGRVRAHLEAARLSLLSPEHGERLFLALYVPRPAAAGVIDTGALARALVEYDAAFALAPDDKALAIERAAVVAAAGSLRVLTAVELPMLALHASRWRAGESPPSVADAELGASSAADRRALGLFAYLTGDAALCSRAWAGMDLDPAVDPLVDAALGELHLQMEQPALAYPRLEAASRAFPDSGFMRVQLAAAAVRCGDVERCGRLLDEAERMSGHDRFSSRKAVRAEWHAARGAAAEARELFEWLRLHHRVPSTRARYARWLGQQGEPVAAITVAGESVDLQPDMVRFRRLFVDLVAAWWRGLGRDGKWRWLTGLAMQGEGSWLLGVLRRYAESLRRLSGDASGADEAVTGEESAIVGVAVASPEADRCLLDLVSALESSPVTLTHCPSDSPLVRSLQVAAWLAPRPWIASMAIELARRAQSWAAPFIAALPLLCPFVVGASSSPAQCVPPPSGLVSWWSAEGHSSDLVGTNHLQLQNGASYGPGMVGQSFVFDGLDDYAVTVVPPGNLSLAAAFTLACWFRTSSTARQNLLTYYDVPNARGFGLQLPLPSHESANRLLLDVYAPWPGNWVRLTSLGVVNDGAWHYAVVTRDAGSVIRLHVDAALQGSAVLIGDATPLGAQLFLGSGLSGSEPWSGGLDELDFYDRALTAAEIAAIYAAGPAGKCAPNPVDATQTTVDSGTVLVSSFAGEATITVIPRNSVGAQLGAGRGVLLATSSGTLLGSVTDNGDGTYTQVLQATPAATGATVSAIVDGIAISDTAIVTFIPIDPAQSTIAVAPDTTFLGGHTTVTVIPRNDVGVPVGSGRTILLQTTLGTLSGAVTDHGDGTYSQSLHATAVGTASITATVDGLQLTSSASLTILDSSIGAVIGLRADLTALPYGTIQQAVNSAETDQLVRILINPGVHEELITVKQKQGLAFEGLSATGVVTVRGFRISQSQDVSVAWLDVHANVNARHGIQLVGGHHANARIAVHQCSIRGATDNYDGIRIGRDNEDIVLDSLLIEQSAGDGVQLADGPSEVEMTGLTIRSSGRNGVRCTDDATLRIAHCVIEDSGTRGDDRQGYGVFRQRRAQGGNATSITLIGNLFANNRGRIVVNKSDANLGNYDQILDPSDNQAGY